MRLTIGIVILTRNGQTFFNFYRVLLNVLSSEPGRKEISWHYHLGGL